MDAPVGAARRLPDPGGDLPFPFVVGESRSGTTLLRLMLDAHPDLAIPPESYFITGLHKVRDRYVRSDGRFDLPRFADDLAGLPKFAAWDLPEDRFRAAFREPAGVDFAAAVRLLYRTYAEAHGKPRYGDKSPGYVSRMRLLAGLFPEARFVHVIRDGRSVALSLADMPWGTRDAIEGAAQWRHRVAQGRESGRALGSDRYLELRYEDLVADAPARLREVGAFLDLPFDPSMLGYAEGAMDRIPEGERYMHRNVARAPTAGLRDWRAEMSPEDLEVVEAVAGDLLAALGYERAVPEPSAEARARADRAVAEWESYRRGKKRKGRLHTLLTRILPLRLGRSGGGRAGVAGPSVDGPDGDV